MLCPVSLLTGLESRCGSRIARSADHEHEQPHPPRETPETLQTGSLTTLSTLVAPSFFFFLIKKIHVTAAETANFLEFFFSSFPFFVFSL